LSKQDGVKSFVIEAGEDAVRKQVQAWREAIHKQEAARELAAAKTLYATLFSLLKRQDCSIRVVYSRLVLLEMGRFSRSPTERLRMQREIDLWNGFR